MDTPTAAMTSDDAPALGLALPAAFRVSVIMEQRPSASPWHAQAWSAIGVTVDGRGGGPAPERILHHGAVERFRYSGYPLRLHTDACERYYHNLLSPEPRCFVLASKGDGGPPRPLRVTLDFDAAQAHEEMDGVVYAVDLPPELYRWCEAFVLEHYVQEPRYKRERTDGTDQHAEPAA